MSAPVTAEDYAALPWSYYLSQIARDTFIAGVCEMPDLFAAGSTPGEAQANLPDALLSHLRGYLATGTPIPPAHGKPPAAPNRGEPLRLIGGCEGR